MYLSYVYLKYLIMIHFHTVTGEFVINLHHFVSFYAEMQIMTFQWVPVFMHCILRVLVILLNLRLLTLSMFSQEQFRQAEAQSFRLQCAMHTRE